MRATGNRRLDVVAEASAIADALKGALPRQLDGRAAILELKEVDYQWRQAEWIGWYYEWKLGEVLTASIGGGAGPRYGRTAFDYRNGLVWDFKAHPLYTGSGKPNEPMILNDKEAVERCIEDEGGLGFVVVNGVAGFEDSAEFKAWHDELKGGLSTFERERIARGSFSRRRKTSFALESLDFYFFESTKDLEVGLAEGWLGTFQEGMRNADGSPRRAKYSVRTDRVPNRVRAIPSVRF